MGQTSEWFQASLSEIILYQLQTPSAVALDTQPIAQLKHNPEASHRLEMNFPVQFLGQATGLDMSPDQIELAQSPLVPVRIETSSNSKLSRAMLLRCFEYAYKHKVRAPQGHLFAIMTNVTELLNRCSATTMGHVSCHRSHAQYVATHRRPAARRALQDSCNCRA